MQAGLGVDNALLIGAGLLLLAALTSTLFATVGSRLRVPGALLFLVLGMVVGSEGLDLVELSDPALVQNIGAVALIFILLEGGLTTKPTDLRLSALPGGLLATIGVVITAAITGFGTWWLLDVEVETAALIGAVVASTDAAAVFGMMRNTPLPRRVSAMLRFESGANDPIAVMLTVGLVATVTGDGVTSGDWVRFATVQFGGGLLVGCGIGLAAVGLLRRLELGTEGMYPVIAWSMGAIAYGVGAALGASGFVAVYVCGIFIGGLVPRHRRSILGVHEALANAAEIGLFLLLGLLVFPSELPGVAIPALLVAGVLTLVARPIAVGLCTMFQGFDLRTRALLVWGGLRGAVPIVLATFPAVAGVEESAVIFNVVFFVVLVSVLVQGTTLLPLVRVLGLTEERRGWAPVVEVLPIDGVDVDVIEVHVTEDLPLHGRSLRDVPPPDRALVATILRGNRVLIPRGDTRLADGDILLLTSQRQEEASERVTAWARGELPAMSDPDASPDADADVPLPRGGHDDR